MFCGEGLQGHELFCSFAEDDEAGSWDEGDGDDQEYRTDPFVREARTERRCHDLTLTQQTRSQNIEAEPGDANLSTRTRVLETTIALGKHEENPTKLNGVEDDDEASFADESENPIKLNGFEEEDDDDDRHLAEPGAGAAAAAAALPVHSALSRSNSARLHSLYEQGHVQLQKTASAATTTKKLPPPASPAAAAAASADEEREVPFTVRLKECSADEVDRGAFARELGNGLGVGGTGGAAVRVDAVRAGSAIVAGAVHGFARCPFLWFCFFGFGFGFGSPRRSDG